MNHKTIALSIITGLTLVACGGSGGSGGGSGQPNSLGTAEGLWRGSASNNRSIAGVVLDNDVFWLLYSSSGNSAVVAGAVQGNGNSSNGNFTSSNGKDFNLEGMGISNFTLSGNYVEDSTLNGTITYSSGETLSFTTNYDTDYDLAPSFSIISGTYTGTAYTSAGAESASFTVSDAGAISGSGASGCNFNGSISPRTQGNVYNVSVMFQGGACANGNSTVNGVAYFDAATNQLDSAALNSARTDGFIYIGRKP